MFGYPDLDAGLNTSRFGGDIAFSDRQQRPRLAKPCLRHFKSGDKPLEKPPFNFITNFEPWKLMP